MNLDAYRKIAELARSDAEFFHKLVFNPESALDKLQVDRRTKGAILSVTSNSIIARLIGLQECGWTCSDSCGYTCGASSCGHTTGSLPQREFGAVAYSRQLDDVMECGNTCSTSCGNTCGSSCGFTTNRAGGRDFGELGPAAF